MTYEKPMTEKVAKKIDKPGTAQVGAISKVPK